jgi:glutaredoxin
MEKQPPIAELYWLPGCSSCLRVKEFVERSKVAFEEINVLEQPERAEKLTAIGLYTPAVCVGERCVSGTGLDAVAALLGIPYERPPMLSPDELLARYLTILDAARRYIQQLPSDGLAFSLPGRERPMIDVANQTVSVIRGFLAAYYDGTHDRRYTKLPDDVRNVADLVARADETRALVRTWWDDDGCDDPLDRVIDTPWWGHRTLLEVFEREVWHTAQHTRQLMLALELLGIDPDRPLAERDFAGLPLPEGIHG